MKRALALACLALPLAACAADAGDPSTVATGGDESDLTAATAARLRVPLDVLRATFYVKSSPIDQSSLGVVLAGGVAFAPGASSRALPSITTLDRKPFGNVPTTGSSPAPPSGVLAGGPPGVGSPGSDPPEPAGASPEPPHAIAVSMHAGTSHHRMGVHGAHRVPSRAPAIRAGNGGPPCALWIARYPVTGSARPAGMPRRARARTR